MITNSVFLFKDFSISNIRIKIFNIGTTFEEQAKPRTNSNRTNTESTKDDLLATTQSSNLSTNPSSKSTNNNRDKNDSFDSDILKNMSENLFFDLRLNLQKNLIHMTSALGLLPFVKYLIEEKGIDKDLRDEDYRTPAHHAALNNSIDCLKYLIEEREANEFAQDKQGNTLLHMSASAGAMVSSENFIDFYFEINFRFLFIFDL